MLKFRKQYQVNVFFKEPNAETPKNTLKLHIFRMYPS